jgi:hypothetical protein
VDMWRSVNTGPLVDGVVYCGRRGEKRTRVVRAYITPLLCELSVHERGLPKPLLPPVRFMVDTVSGPYVFAAAYSSSSSSSSVHGISGNISVKQLAQYSTKHAGFYCLDSVL